ncbi:MAG TPA: 3-deoxy-manno-octulosonate cytidylyltransferase [Verrucomicrobiae bacterium]|jgi:3-deoxy-manno-octulosonate cytidylyltransferase (CMP-KDO synthetase)|nr:3-deoxy-manno-octulosonate cytidylyltransferase [Verrucomicrobiae bacterium]
MGDSIVAVAIIPARLGSTRLSRKVLRPIAGKPMLAHVYDAARKSPLLRDVIIATDSDEVLQVARANGWRAEMTSAQHRSGTDRVHEVAQRVAADVYVNIQGDEPLARPEHLKSLLEPMRDSSVMVSTIKTLCPPQDVNNPNAVKVVTDHRGRALYFSRSAIPFDRDRAGNIQYFKHLGFYAYRKAALDRFCTLPESKLEAAERLEQLRFLENDIDIFVAETPFNTVGVDTEEDLLGVERILMAGS